MDHTAFCDAGLTLPEFSVDSIGKFFRRIIQSPLLMPEKSEASGTSAFIDIAPSLRAESAVNYRGNSFSAEARRVG